MFHTSRHKLLLLSIYNIHVYIIKKKHQVITKEIILTDYTIILFHVFCCVSRSVFFGVPLILIHTHTHNIPPSLFCTFPSLRLTLHTGPSRRNKLVIFLSPLFPRLSLQGLLILQLHFHFFLSLYTFMHNASSRRLQLI